MRRYVAVLGAGVLVAGLIGASGPAAAQPEGVPGPAGGSVVGFGSNEGGRLNVPVLPSGMFYAAITAGGSHSVALRSDGRAVAFGDASSVDLRVPALPAGTRYTAASTGAMHSLLLRSDGRAVAFGANFAGERDVPVLLPGRRYTAVSAGWQHSLALRSDGTVAAFGQNGRGQLNVPALPSGMRYTAVAAGDEHSLALRSDGRVVGFGSNVNGQTSVPALPPGLRYTAVAAGGYHSLALRSDGRVVGFGYDSGGQASVPPLPAGLRYDAIDAGAYHSLALRSDGRVVAFGSPSVGQTAVPAPSAGRRVVGIAAGAGHSLLLVAATPYFRVSAARATAGRTAVVPVAVDGLDLPGTAYDPSPGTVTVRRGSQVLGRATLRGGRAGVPVPTAALAAGSYGLTVAYSGGGTTAPGTATARLTVVKALPVVRVTAPRKVARGKKPKVTIRVRATGLRPTGTVRVYDGRKRLRAVTLRRAQNGVVRVTLPKLRRVGKHKVRVVYLGDGQLHAASATTTIRVRR